MIERVLASMLLNALWEPLAVAILAFAILRAARSASAATRSAVLAAALFASLVLPAATTAAVYFPQPAPDAAGSARTARSAPPVVRAMPAPPLDALAAMPLPQRPQFTVSPRGVIAIVCAWALVALVLMIRLTLSMRHLLRLRRNALPLAAERREALTSGLEGIRLCVSDETSVPIAVGVFDAMVVIPRSLIDDLCAEDLDRIVQHEIAHLRRRDALTYLAQQFGCALFFFSPGLHWLAHSLDIEREVACDDWVLQRNAAPATYASCLVRLAERTTWPHRAMPAPGAFVSRRSMSIRVERILQRARDARLYAAPGPVAAAIALIAAVAIAGLGFAPSLAYTIACTLNPAHPSAAWKPSLETIPLPAVRVAAARTQPPSAPAPRIRGDSAAAAVVAARPAQTGVRPEPHAILTVPVQHTVNALLAVATASPVPFARRSPGDYIDDMRALFGANISVETLVALKSAGVTAEYVAQLRAAGYPGVSAREAAAARAMDLTAQRIADLRSAFGALSLNELIALQSEHVDAAYRDQLKAAGLTGLTARTLVELKALDVMPSDVQQAQALGLGRLGARQIGVIKALQIDAAFLQRVREHGYLKPTLDQLIMLRSAGVIQ